MINIISELIASGLLLILLFLAVQGQQLLTAIGPKGLRLAIAGLAMVVLANLGELIAYGIAFYASSENLDTVFAALKLLESIGITIIIIGGLLWLPQAKKIVRTAIRLTTQNQALSEAVDQSATELETTRKTLEDERLLFLSGPMASCKWRPDSHWQTTYASSNIFSVLGYSNDEITDNNFNFIKFFIIQ